MLINSCQTSRHHIPDDIHLHSDCLGNFRTQTLPVMYPVPQSFLHFTLSVPTAHWVCEEEVSCSHCSHPVSSRNFGFLSAQKYFIALYYWLCKRSNYNNKRFQQYNKFDLYRPSSGCGGNEIKFLVIYFTYKTLLVLCCVYRIVLPVRWVFS